MFQDTLEVKSTKTETVFFSVLFILPIIFLGISSAFFGISLLGFLAFILSYFGLITWFVVHSQKRKNIYEIIANKQTVTFRNHGTYDWNQISAIKTFQRFDWPINNRPEDYLEIYLNDNKGFIIKTTFYDLTLKDLESRLKRIGGLG